LTIAVVAPGPLLGAAGFERQVATALCGLISPLVVEDGLPVPYFAGSGLVPIPVSIDRGAVIFDGQLSCGEEAKVNKPQWLVKEVIEKVRGMMGTYGILQLKQ
jgi:hypothetical protein